MWLLDKLLNALVREGRLVLTDHDGKVYSYGDPAADPVAIRLTDKGAALHIARDPRLGAGEAYMDGRLVVEAPHDIRAMVLLVMRNVARSSGGLKPPGPVRRLTDRIGSQLDQVNFRSRASNNVVHHYGLTREFYELFLDADRMYSMAYFTDPANSLEQAQVDKKALIAAKLAIPRDGKLMRVLDIGCGWGGMGLFLNRHYGCEVLGVSLAPDQVQFANERAAAAGVADKVRFELIDYRDVQGKFDRICSIGMIEHLGKPHYREYFAKTFDLLADDGVMLTHTIGKPGMSGSTDAFVRKYVFPGHYLPCMSDLTRAHELAGWKIAEIEELRTHYAWTLAEWYRRATLHQREIVDLFDARFFRMWQFYLAGCEQGFANGTMVNFHVQAAKRANVLPVTRDYIAAERARLSAAEVAPEWHLERRAAE
jgi:cyclopropane-fatty-acyl-phospholipid synthase